MATPARPSSTATAPRPSRVQTARRPPAKSLGTLFQELRELIVAYAKQETVEPLRGLARYVLWGVAGSLLLGIGLVLLLLGGLRALQEETGEHFTGHLTWVPYLITLAATIVIAGIAATRISKGGRS